MELSSQLAGNDKERTHVNCWWFAFEATITFSQCIACVPTTIVLKPGLSTSLLFLLLLGWVWMSLSFTFAMMMSWFVFLMFRR